MAALRDSVSGGHIQLSFAGAAAVFTRRRVSAWNRHDLDAM